MDQLGKKLVNKKISKKQSASKPGWGHQNLQAWSCEHNNPIKDKIEKKKEKKKMRLIFKRIEFWRMKLEMIKKAA
jgi:hypothetical protein